MTQKDLKRLDIIIKVYGHWITQREAGELLKLSERQIRRLIKRYKAKGGAGLIHDLRGKESKRKRSDKETAGILKLPAAVLCAC